MNVNQKLNLTYAKQFIIEVLKDTTNEKKVKYLLALLQTQKMSFSSSSEQKTINHWSFSKDVYFVFKMYVSKVLLNFRTWKESHS